MHTRDHGLSAVQRAAVCIALALLGVVLWKLTSDSSFTWREGLMFLKTAGWDWLKISGPLGAALGMVTVFIYAFLPDRQTEEGYKALLGIIFIEIILALAVGLHYATAAARH